MNIKTCCFTGHRQIPEEDTYPLIIKLRQTITEMVKQGVTHFKNGGALGFDTLAAMAVLDARKENPSIKLEMVLPCMEQTRGWKANDKKLYNHILHRADEIMYTSKHYYAGCMQTRNRYLVDNSDLCIVYMIKYKGGTFYTVKYAGKKNIPVINLGAPAD